jgi:release factor glutamine methyltransferase
MTCREALNAGSALLRSSGLESPSLDASLFMADLLAVERSRLPLLEDRELSPELYRRFRERLERRRAGECAAYILGRREFMGLDLAVTAEVLVPRPDTETLVEAALAWIDHPDSPRGSLSVLDLCTGSGAVAEALKHERPDLILWASDISAGALAVAEANARRLLGPDKITFVRSDLFKAITGSFDLIAANPPYIPAGELESLPREVRGEPVLALDGGEDGLALIRPLIAGARDRLKQGGALFMEADPRQMPAITGILENCGYRNIRIRKDLPGRDRVIGAVYG